MIPAGCVLAAASLGALLATAPTPAAAQTPAALLVTVLDTDGVPVAGLTRADFTVRQGDGEVEVVSVQPVAPTH